MPRTTPIMPIPTHDDIAQLAHELWQDRGCPADRDLEFWLEAERLLSGGKTAEIFTERARAETAAESNVEYHLSPAGTEQEAIKAAMLKQSSRAPQTPHHTGPSAKPAETGKPLWSRPHSA
jgi:hypothetical protein